MDTLKNILEASIGGFTVAKLLGVVLLVMVCLAVVKLLLRVLDRLFVRLHVPKTILGMLRAIVKVVLLFLVVVIAMGYLGIPVTSLVAVLSVVGVAVSLGVQNFLTNVVGGFQLLASQPFEVGDYVDAGGCSGTVQEVGLFYTKVITPDNKLIQLPNGSVVAANITNYSSQPTRRVEVVVSASYDAPVEQVEQVLLAVASGHEKVLPDPAPFARVSKYAASSIEYTVRVWCANGDYWDVYFDLLKAVKTAFDQNGIQMTYDHVNVHVIQDL